MTQDAARPLSQSVLDNDAEIRELLDHLRCGVVVHGPDGGIIYFNPRAAQLLGMESSALETRSALDPDWCIVDETLQPLATQDFPVSVVLRVRQPMERGVYGVRHRADAPLVWIMADAFPLFHPDGSIKHVVVNFDDISHRKRAEQEVQRLAFFDALTGLPNRRMLKERLHAALSASARNGLVGAVLFIDLDNFKAVNDLLGHNVGDQLLVEVAGRIGHCLRDNDLVARLGGDEFVVLVADLAPDLDTASQSSAHIAEKIRTALALPYQLGEHIHHSSPSIGVAMYSGATQSQETVLRQADMAMYKAKEAGRNTFRFFSPAMQLAVETRAALEADLRHAVRESQLCLHFQPQIDAAQQVVGAEALVRWQHPGRGMLGPNEFIPIAEESGLALEIGAWVLESVCAQLARWHAQPEFGHLSLSVNVSARQFRHADFIDMLGAALQRHRFDIDHLKLELSESLVLADVDEMVRKMEQVQQLGIDLSMDGFGTGFSSLGCLKRLPLGQLKIDQSFVRDIMTDPNDAIMVKTIIDLARNFNLEPIAEGVETEEQIGFLRQHGCQAYQGFLFGVPVPIGAFEAQLRARMAVEPGAAE